MGFFTMNVLGKNNGIQYDLRSSQELFQCSHHFKLNVWFAFISRGLATQSSTLWPSNFSNFGSPITNAKRERSEWLASQKIMCRVACPPRGSAFFHKCAKMLLLRDVSTNNRFINQFSKSICWIEIEHRL